MGGRGGGVGPGALREETAARDGPECGISGGCTDTLDGTISQVVQSCPVAIMQRLSCHHVGRVHFNLAGRDGSVWLMGTRRRRWAKLSRIIPVE